MPITVSAAAGDGINNAALRMNVQLPDSGSQITVQGIYQSPSFGQSLPQQQQAVLAFAGTTTSPGANSTWTTYWSAQLVPASTTLTVASGTSGFPVAPAGNVVLFQQALGTAAGTTVTLQPAIIIPKLSDTAPY